MKEFNYRRAHAEMAVPEFHKLPQAVKDLWERTKRETVGVKQLPNLALDTSKIGGLVDAFAAVAAADPEALARAEVVVYFCGHWDAYGHRDASDAGEWPREPENTGAYWKFEKLAAAALIVREGHCGELRHKVKTEWDARCRTFDDHKDGTGFDDGEVAEFFRVLEPEFEVVRCTRVNHKPDIFVIDRKHFNTDSGYLDPRRAPCARCGQPYDKHTSDRVVVLKNGRGGVVDGGITDAGAVKLKSVEPLCKAHGIAGYAFAK